MQQAYNSPDFNVGNSVFPGFNDRHGLVLCGYEWGHSAKDQALENDAERYAAAQEHLASINTFYSKGWDSPYDRRIVKWFEMFGHPLGRDGGFSALDKAILQTNWCDDQATEVSDYEKFLSEANLANLLGIMCEFRPALLVFMGIKQIEFLQDPRVMPAFQELFGREVSPLRFDRREEFDGKKFRVGFQKFEHLSVVALPHPSGSMGLSDRYISLYADEIGALISEFKRHRGFDEPALLEKA